MRILLAAMMTFMVACGSDDSDSSGEGGSKLVGTWIYGPANSNNGIYLDIKDDGTYQSSFMVISGNAVASETEFGDYAEAGSQVTFTPTRSSCAESESDSMAFSFSGGNLQLTIDASTFIFAPEDEAETAAADISGTTMTTGCFDAEGNFTPRSVQDL